MRTLLAALFAAAGLAAAGRADDEKKDAPKKPETSLKVGDKAPALKATKWLQGGEVPALAEGKVYVVEFWATWCGPCIVMMPHLADLQKEYRDKGVTVIGFTKKDDNNTAEKVEAFVKKRGPKLGYTFAFADDVKTYEAWMTASGQQGIPCSFVVGKDGKLAYIGHPMFLDLVMPKVVAGSWTAADAEKLKEADKATDAVFEALAPNADAEAGLKKLAEYEKAYPGLGNVPYFVGPKIAAYLKTKNYDEAKKVAEAVIAKATAQDDSSALSGVARAVKDAAKDKPEFGALGVKAAEAALKIVGDADGLAQLTLADAHAAAGDKAKAKAAAEKAVAAVAKADDARLKQYVERQAKKYTEEEKKDK